MGTRRPRGRDHAAVAAARGATEQFSQSGMFYAAPMPPTRISKPSISPLAARGLKPTRLTLRSPPCTNNQLFQDSVGTDTDCSAPEKLAFDELLRVQRGRAEDVGKLIASLGALVSDGGGENRGAENQNEKDKNRRAAMYREEWRIAREDDVLRRIQDGETRDEALSAEEQARKADALRVHVRRSIHCFLMADRGGDASASTQPKTKLSNDLFYAQQMDRLLREIDQQHPFAVVRHAIADARTKFQQLLTCSSQTTSLVCTDQQPETLSTDTLPGITTEESAPNLLDLYENVVDARSVAAPMTSITSSKGRIKTPRIVSATAPSTAFVENLEKQREEAEMRAQETLAQSHWRMVCAKRIQTGFIRHRKRQQRRKRLDLLWERTRQRAAVVLQMTLLCAVRAFRALKGARDAMRRKHQGSRIATCCFWRWMYRSRCGLLSVFELLVVVTPRTIAAIVCIQNHWRRRRATRDVGFKRAFHGHRTKRRKQRQWRQWRQHAQTMVPINLQVVECHCHLAIEKNRVLREQQREQQRFAAEWARYEARLEKDVLKAKLPSEWIPQLDPLSGETFYLNVQTTKTSSEHPNRALLRQLLKKQKRIAEQLYDEKQARLKQYAESLEAQTMAVHASLAMAYNRQESSS